MPTAAGTQFEIVFPNPFLITRCNLYLRADSSPLSTDPYRAGWLFEGVPETDTPKGLLRGAHAAAWMEEEQRRINEFLQRQQACAADGGLFAEGVVRSLDSDCRRTLFQEFFSPFAREKSAS